MTRKHTILAAAASLLGLIATSCDAMWDTSLDVPLGYGGNLGIGVSSPIFTYDYWYPGWDVSFWKWNSPIWGGALPPRPPVRPGIVAPPPPSANPNPNPGNNWRPPVSGTKPPFTTTPAPVLPPASTGTPTTPVSPVRPGRH